MHIRSQAHCVGDVVALMLKRAYHAHMPHDYIRAWREYRRKNGEPHLTLVGVQDAFGMTHQNIGRIETGKVPYSREFLEIAAKLYRCTKADLLEHDPNEPAVRVLDMLRQLSPEQLKMLLA
jgi:transcriptional regulator with XRE-family HTH domain